MLKEKAIKVSGKLMEKFVKMRRQSGHHIAWDFCISQSDQQTKQRITKG